MPCSGLRQGGSSEGRQSVHLKLLGEYAKFMRKSHK
jgi:hypothetical protein